ncbi:Threonine dehydratase, mitochondrial [Eumeta japonica]|uniref:Serine racemase n=1 Tax=Eumeta variegata TaxID=151549 RepID=A0A4C1ZGZ8_EUMVA|nr:Threonine dehydratase, mitochondrial [Eumeta japonica]
MDSRLSSHTHTAKHSVIDRTLLSTDRLNPEKAPDDAHITHQPRMPVGARRTPNGGLEVVISKPERTVFKERGALNLLVKLAQDNKKRGVVSASIGNHALSLCYHAAKLKIPVTMVMPETVPIMKQEQCRKLGAKVVLHGMTLLEARGRAYDLAVEKKLTFINGSVSDRVIASHGDSHAHACF